MTSEQETSPAAGPEQAATLHPGTTAGKSRPAARATAPRSAAAGPAAAAPVDSGPAAAPRPEQPAAAKPCADCAEKDRSLLERVDRLEHGQNTLAKAFVTAVVAAVVIYALAGREQAER